MHDRNGGWSSGGQIGMFLDDIDGIDRVTDIKTRQLTHRFMDTHFVAVS